MVRSMTQENDNEEDAQDTAEDIVEDSGELLESVRKMIQDEIKAALSSVPGEGSASNSDELDEPLTLRAMEASVRKAVEEAMEPLRASQTKPKPKKKTAPKEVEPEPAPIEKDVRSKLTSFLWGES